MPKIITVTANTAIDQHIELKSLTLGGINTAQHSLEFAAGKGINVAKALQSMQQPVIALGFVGQQSESHFTLLNTSLLQTQLTPVAGKTRTNITLSTGDNKQETHIKTPGYSVTDAECERLITQLKAISAPQDLVILSGSLPNGAPVDFYKQLIHIIHTLGGVTFLDSHGAALAAGLQATPYLIKPNELELAELMGYPLSTEIDIIAAAQTLIKQGIRYVIVSRGAEGALLISANTILRATTAPSRTPIISTIGCGDAMIAGLAMAKLQQLEVVATLTLGMACATANLWSAEPGVFSEAQLIASRTYLSVKSVSL